MADAHSRDASLILPRPGTADATDIAIERVETPAADLVIERVETPDTELVVRLAQEHDAEEIARVEVEGWQWAYDGVMPEEFLDKLCVHEHSERWQQALTGPRDPEAIVADADGSVVGYSAFGTSRDDDAVPGTGELWSIYLRQQWAGNGLGRNLLEHTLDGLRVLGFERCTLWVVAENERARRFYESAGLEFEGTLREDPCGDDHVIVDARYAIEL